MTDKLRNFFEKRKRDSKFTGQGHRLNETANQASGSSKEPIKQPERAEPCSEAKQAGLAALARLANKSGHSGFAPSFSAQHKMMKREAALASGLGGEGENLEDTSSEPIVKEFLAVQGVYFKCPLVGTEILTKEEWKNKIKNFLYEQLETEKGFTSCLMIHTLNKTRDKELCIETLCTYLQNIITHPDEEKYKKIRIMNRVFQERVSKMLGANEFLEAAGFMRETIAINTNEEEDYYVFISDTPDIPHLELMVDTIRNTESIPIELHRNIQVLKPAQAKVMVQLPDDFYALTPDEIKREQKKRTENLETSMLLRTKAMREKEEQREIRKYRYTLIRVRFPDGHFLQGTFAVFERLGVVKEFVSECVAENVGPFSLTTALGVQLPESEHDKTLIELKLVPAVMLTFVPANVLPAGQQYLMPDLQLPA